MFGLRSGNLGRMKDTGRVEDGPEENSPTLAFQFSSIEESVPSMESEKDTENYSDISHDAALKAKAAVQKSVSDLLAKRAAESGLLRKSLFGDAPSDSLVLPKSGDVNMERLLYIEQELVEEKARAVSAAVDAKVSEIGRAHV